MIKVNISYRNKKIVLETKCRVSILSDNSGIGKTYLLKVIKQALEASEYSPLKAEKDGKECKECLDKIYNESCKKSEVYNNIRRKYTENIECSKELPMELRNRIKLLFDTSILMEIIR